MMACSVSGPCASSDKTTRLVADLVSVQNLRRWIDKDSEHHRYENFRCSLSAYLESCCVFSQEEKLMWSQQLLTELEEEQEQQELLVKSEDYRRGYEAAMAAFHKFCGFELLEISSNQNEEVAQSISVERPCSEILENKEHMIVESCQALPLDILVTCMEAATFESISNFSKCSITDGSIDEQVFFAFEDPFAALLESSMEGSFLMFIDDGDILFRWGGLPCFHSGYLIGEVGSLLQFGTQLLDWLHWKSAVT